METAIQSNKHIIAIGGRDYTVMMGLIGINGFTIEENQPALFEKRFQEIIIENNAGLILVSEQYIVRFRAFFKRQKYNHFPIIMEVPDLQEPVNDSYFRRIIQSFLGLSYKQSGEVE